MVILFVNATPWLMIDTPNFLIHVCHPYVFVCSHMTMYGCVGEA